MSSLISRPSQYAKQLDTLGYVNTAKYLKGILSLARRLANRYGSANDFEDVAQIAIHKATMLESSYDENTAGFFTYVRPHIEGAARKYYNISKSDLKKYNRIKKFIQMHESTNSTQPTVKQIAEAVHLTESEINLIFFHKNKIPQEFVQNTEFSDDALLVSEMLEELSLTEQELVLSVFYYEMSIRDVAVSMQMTYNDTVYKLNEALYKLKEVYNA